MKIVAYNYVDPIVDQISDLNIWGWDIDRVYQDIGDRRELTQLMVDIDNDNSIVYLLVFHLYELGDDHRQVIENINHIESLNIEIIALEQNYKSSDFQIIDNHQQKQKLETIWLEIETTLKERKLQKAHAQNRLQIKPPPGRPPFGYSRGKNSYILNRATTPIIRDFFDRFLLYGSIRDAVRFLANKYNKKITASTARYWLTNPVYRGNLRYKNQQIVSDTHTAIITPEESAQIDRILKSHSRVKSRSASASHCLAGLVVCNRCQSPWRVNCVTQKFKSKQYLYLTPIACSERRSCSSIKYDQIFEQVIVKTCQQFSVIKKGVKTPEIKVIQDNINQQITSKEQIINQLDELVTQNILDEQTAKLRNYQLRTEIAQLKQKMGELPPNNLETIAKTLSLKQFWYDLSEQERRFYLREFIKSIQINYCDRDEPKDREIEQISIDFIFSF